MNIYSDNVSIPYIAVVYFWYKVSNNIVVFVSTLKCKSAFRMWDL